MSRSLLQCLLVTLSVVPFSHHSLLTYTEHHPVLLLLSLFCPLTSPMSHPLPALPCPFLPLPALLCQMDELQLQPPRPLPWYPDDYAWHLDLSRKQLRTLPALES